MVESHVEAVREEVGLQAGGAEHPLLREGYALAGEPFLGVDGLVDGCEVRFEMGDLIEVFEPDDGEGGGGEATGAGIAGGAGIAFGSAGRRVETTLRAGALRGVGAIGGELFFRDGHANGSLSISLSISEIAWEVGESAIGRGQVVGRKGFISLEGA